MNTKQIMLAAALASLVSGAATLPSLAAVLPIVNAGFDANTGLPNNWRGPIGATDAGAFLDGRHLSPGNLMGGTSSDGSATGELQYIATDHAGEPGTDANVAATQLLFQPNTLYTLSAYAFAGPAGGVDQSYHSAADFVLVPRFDDPSQLASPFGKVGMADQLAAKYAAPREAILTDVIGMLQDLADKGFLTEAREKTS